MLALYTGEIVDRVNFQERPDAGDKDFVTMILCCTHPGMGTNARGCGKSDFNTETVLFSGPTVDWYWLTPARPLLRLVSGLGHRLTLERQGERVFEVDRPLPTADHEALYTWHRRAWTELTRTWLNFMFHNDWIDTVVTEQGDVLVVAYPGEGTEFAVVILPLRGQLPLDESDVVFDPNSGKIIVGYFWPFQHQQRFDTQELLWSRRPPPRHQPQLSCY